MTDLNDAKLVGDEIVDSPYGPVELQHTFITDESSRRLFDAMDFQRACQAYIWSTPLVSFYSWRQEQMRVYETTEVGEFAVFVSLKEKRGIVTANLTTPYIISFFDLSQGALVVDYPPGPTAGGLLDFWQRPIADMGLTGPDRGKGGRFIVVGPEDDLAAYKNENAYIYRSETNDILVGLRLLDSSEEFAETFKQALKIGIFGGKMVSSQFKANLDREWDATAPRGLTYWKYLLRAIDNNPVREQDKVWMAMLEPLGIKKGELFAPDARQTRILLEGAAMGELMTRNLQINPRFTEPYWAGTHWYKCFDFTIPQMTDYKVELDERATWFYEAVTSSEGMVNPVVGMGQVYMTTKRDRNGNLFRADRTYRLYIPNGVPVVQFWSLTLYSENTRRPYNNGGTEIRSTSLDSRMEQLRYNHDGSLDLFIGAEAPAGWERNFMQTNGEDGWFVYFRLYAPTEPFFDKSYSLPDFEVIG